MCHWRSKSHIITLVLVILLTGRLGFSGESTAQEGSRRLYTGETLVFQLRWGVIPAGEAVLQVLPVKTVLGVEVLHFAMTTKTYPFFDLFYKVRDRIDAYTDVNVTRSIQYRKKQREGRVKRDVVVTFDWENHQVQYSNFGKKKEPISVIPGSFDPLSALYAFRLHDLEERQEVRLPLTDGKKSVVGRARVVKRESIQIGIGTYDTFLVEPELKHVRGVFEKSKNAKLKIWVTADDRRIPVLLKSKVIIGSVVAELIAIDYGPESKGVAEL